MLWDRPNIVRSRTGSQHVSKKVNLNLQRRLQLLRKIERIGSGPWSWSASLPQGGCLIRFPIGTQSAHRHSGLTVSATMAMKASRNEYGARILEIRPCAFMIRLLLLRYDETKQGLADDVGVTAPSSLP